MDIQITECPPPPFYYDTLCTFTCPYCGGLMKWGAYECFGACDDCIDSAMSEVPGYMAGHNLQGLM